MRNRFGTDISLLWICGASLRISILAVPPVIPLIQTDLHLSGTEIGILSGLPVIVFAIFAPPGSLLVARMGVLLTLTAGLAVAAAGAGLRAVVGNSVELYAATILMSAGIAVMQPAMSAAVRQWLPSRVGLGTAVYTNGLIVGEIIPVAIMLPLLLPMFNQSWRLALAAWSIPIFIIGIAVTILAPRSSITAVARRAIAWWPNWRSNLIWRMGMILGSVTSSYFCTNAFLPSHLIRVGRAELVSPALTALNLGQLPASFLLLVIANKVQRKSWPYVQFGALTTASIVGIMLTGSIWTVAWAGLLGFCCGAALPLALALAPLLSEQDDVARTSAAMFAISYGFSMIVSLLSGVTWDMTGHASLAFIPIALASMPVLLFAPAIFLDHR